jgi:hypothetical protein
VTHVQLHDGQIAQQAYVEGWYKRMKQAAWHNTHKGEAYDGYWCFEGALVAMLLNIDDSALQGHIHYPADLVNYYRAAAQVST